VNLIGEHTDYNGGYVLPFAIDRRTEVAASSRSDGLITVCSRQRPDELASLAANQLRPKESGSWADYVFGTVWALREEGHDIAGLDLVIDSAVPTGSGLSSSAALECAVGLAALDLHEIAVAPDTLARIAQHAENDYVGVPCGLMDQMAVSVCRRDHALFFDVRDDIREHEPFAPHRDGLALLVVDTRAHHAHADGGYAQRRQSCETAAAILGVQFLRDVDVADLDAALEQLDTDVLRKRVRHVVTENERVRATVAQLRQGKLADVGPLLTASHESLRGDFEVSCPELDTAVAAAISAGAFGARMTGGGFGGSAIVLVAEDDADRVARAIENAFDKRGFVAPVILTPSIAAGVRRDS
jgi:galactokinase